MSLLGGKCIACGISDFRVLEFDHKNGDGCKARIKQGRKPGSRTGGRTTGEVFKSYNLGELSQVYQLLCANCHAIKTSEKGENNPKWRNGRLDLSIEEETKDLFSLAR